MEHTIGTDKAVTTSFAHRRIEWCQADGGSLMWPLAGTTP